MDFWSGLGPICNYFLELRGPSAIFQHVGTAG
jgi:hypothetical protein